MALPTPLPIITPEEADALDAFMARTDRKFRRALAVQEMIEAYQDSPEDSTQEEITKCP